jgi:hypothetical protein
LILFDVLFWFLSSCGRLYAVGAQTRRPASSGSGHESKIIVVVLGLLAAQPELPASETDSRCAPNHCNPPRAETLADLRRVPSQVFPAIHDDLHLRVGPKVLSQMIEQLILVSRN